VLGALFGEAGMYYFIALYLTAIVVSDIPTYLKEKNNTKYNLLFIVGLIAFLLALMPYLATNKMPASDDFITRFQILLPLGFYDSFSTFSLCDLSNFS
jgi:hypothetical protein